MYGYFHTPLRYAPGMGSISLGTLLTNAFRTRVEADGGTVEATSYLKSTITSLGTTLTDSDFSVLPHGYKAFKLYAFTDDAADDLTFQRASTSTRVNSAGLIETVSSNIPRIDYKVIDAPVILVEPQSTNLVTHSTDISDSSYTIIRASVIDNGITTPIDGQTAQKVVATSATGNHFLREIVSNPTASTYTVSAFIKKAGCNVALRVTGASFSNRIEWQIDLSDGSDINFTQAGTFSGTTSVEALANDWFRVEAVITLSSSDTKLESSFFVLNPANNNVGGWTGDDASGFYLAGYQIENRSGATSYIPTSGTAVTRVADTVQRFNLPIGSDTVVATFEDGTTDVTTGGGGLATYTLPVGRIKSVIQIP